MSIGPSGIGGEYQTEPALDHRAIRGESILLIIMAVNLASSIFG